MNFEKLHGLIAATHTPFSSDGELNPNVVEKLAEHLHRTGANGAFICGTTGESHSLTIQERIDLAKRWSETVRGSTLRLVVHVGSNCLADSRTLAEHAQKTGASAIAALAPSYFKPPSLDILIDWCRQIAAAAPNLPFYFYDIPSMTGVQFSMPQFLATAQSRIPTLVGMKFTNPNLMAYQQCLAADGGKFDVVWGIDEYLLAALSLGATGAVGSSYNFAAPIYARLIAALSRGDMAGARAEQYRSVQLVQLLSSLGYMSAAKATIGFLGVDVGPARLPHANLAPAQIVELRTSLDRLGFFDWVRV